MPNVWVWGFGSKSLTRSNTELQHLKLSVWRICCFENEPHLIATITFVVRVLKWKACLDNSGLIEAKPSRSTMLFVLCKYVLVVGVLMWEPWWLGRQEEVFVGRQLILRGTGAAVDVLVVVAASSLPQRPLIPCLVVVEHFRALGSG